MGRKGNHSPNFGLFFDVRLERCTISPCIKIVCGCVVTLRIMILVPAIKLFRSKDLVTILGEKNLQTRYYCVANLNNGLRNERVYGYGSTGFESCFCFLVKKKKQHKKCHRISRNLLACIPLFVNNIFVFWRQTIGTRRNYNWTNFACRVTCRVLCRAHSIPRFSVGFNPFVSPNPVGHSVLVERSTDDLQMMCILAAKARVRPNTSTRTHLIMYININRVLCAVCRQMPWNVYKLNAL